MHRLLLFNGHLILRWSSTRIFGSSVDPHISIAHVLFLSHVYAGSNSSNFTATNQLFLANTTIDYWRFEVVYDLPSGTSSSALSFVVNQPPRNGSCAVGPLNGTTSTMFTVTCSNWQDADGIKDYSVYSGFILAST